MVNEIFNIGLSHRANHVLTQFYNIQESLLYSSNSDKSKKIVASTQLNSKVDKINKLVDYSPRCLLWDAKNGNGSLGKYQYSINYKDDYFYGADKDSVTDAQQENAPKYKMETEQVIPKSEFQKDLDSGEVGQTYNDSSNYKYWSDYNKLIYHPQSMFQCKNWYHNVDNANKHPPTNFPVTSSSPSSADHTSQPGSDLDLDSFVTFFNNPQSGSLEYEVCRNELWDENMHYWLEQADNLNHINIVSEFDDSWGMVSNRMLEDLKDELPKISIYQFSLSNKQPPATANLINTITNTLSCLENVNLLFPLYYDTNSKVYEQSSQQSVIFQTINSLFDGSGATSHSPNDLTNTLTVDNANRKIVTNIIPQKANSNDSNDFSYFAQYKIPVGHPQFKPWKLKKINPYVFHECSIARVSSPQDSDDLSEKKNDLSEKRNDDNEVVMQTYGLDFANLNTFFTPRSKSTLDLDYLKLQISNDPMVNILKYWEFILTTNYVKKYLTASSTSNLSRIEDVDELVESVVSLKNEYTFKDQYSMYGSDDSDDDGPDEEYYV